MGTAGHDAAVIQTRDELGTALTGLRVRAGLTVRQLATATGIPTATVGGYVTARHLPSVAQTGQFAALLTALEVPEPEHPPWLDALARVRTASRRRTATTGPNTTPPYRGLAGYERADRDVYFGRDDVLARLLDLVAVAEAAEPEAPRVVVVAGASGSGKSSLLRAGLLAEIESGRVPGVAGGRVLTPGSDPIGALTAALAERPDLLVVDQFEEVFTQADAAVRAEFLDTAVRSPARTVIALRSDFWAAAAAEPTLTTALQSSLLLVPPMDAAQLRAAIVQPAEVRGAEVDPELVARILLDLGDGGAPALPLLSHALLTTWQQHTGGRVRLADYLAVGGVAGAVQQTAERAFAAFDRGGHDLVRRVFLRLVTVDEQGTATRRPADRAALAGLAPEAADIVDRFVAARLLTADRDRVEVSHEALLTAWPRLAAWIEADREGLRQHRLLTAAAEAWEQDDRDDGSLLRGGRLETAEQWAADPDNASRLTTEQHAFLDASLRARAAGIRLARRRTNVLRGLVAALTVLVLVAAAALGYALAARHHAVVAEHAAADRRDLNAVLAVANAAAAVTPKDDALAQQLALAAYRTRATPETRSALLDAMSRGVVYRHTGSVGPTAARLDPSGRVLAVSDAASGTVRLFAMAGGYPGRLLSTVPAGTGGQVFALAFDPDGRRLAVGGQDKAVRLIDVGDPTRPGAAVTLPGRFAGAVQSVVFSPDGSRLYAAGLSPSCRAWEVGGADPTPMPLEYAGTTATGMAVALSPDGERLALGSADGTLRIWPTSRLTSQPELGRFSGSAIDAVAYSPDGRTIALGNKASLLTLVPSADLRAGRSHNVGFTTWINALAWTADGTRLAAGGSDGRLVVMDSAATVLATWPAGAPVTSVAFTPRGDHLVYAAADGGVRIRRSLTEFPAPGSVFTVNWDRSSSRLATVSIGSGQVWEAPADGAPVLRFTAPQSPVFGATSAAGALSPDGTVLALGGNDGGVALSSPGRSSATVLRGPTKLVESVAFSADGRLLAAGSDDGKVYRWDLSDPAAPRALPALSAGGFVLGVALSRDGRLLAAAVGDNTAHLWRLSDAGHTADALPAATGFRSYAYAVAFSPDSRRLAVGAADDTVRVYDVRGSRPRPRPVGPRLTGPRQYVFWVAFAPNGRDLSAAAGDGTVWTWRLSGARAERRSVLRTANLLGGTFYLAYSPDGTRLATGGADRTARIFPTDADAAARELCASGSTRLTRAEWAQYVPDLPYRDVCR